MSRIVVKTYYMSTECPCDLRVEQWNDERKKEYGVMVVGKPCIDDECDGRVQAAHIKKWLISRGNVLTIDGQVVH